MVSMKFKVTWKTILLPALGLLAFFIYLYLFKVDIPTIIATIQQVNLSIYLAGVMFILFDVFFFALSWHSLLNFLSVKLSVLKSFLYVWYGIFIDIIIPAESISGEISKIYLVTREQNGTSGKVVASLFTQRLMGMGINLISLRRHNHFDNKSAGQRHHPKSNSIFNNCHSNFFVSINSFMP